MHSFVNRLAIFRNDRRLNVSKETYGPPTTCARTLRQPSNKTNWINGWFFPLEITGNRFSAHLCRNVMKYTLSAEIQMLVASKMPNNKMHNTLQTTGKVKSALQGSQVSVKHYQVLQSQPSQHKLAWTDTAQVREGGREGERGMEQAVKWYY